MNLSIFKIALTFAGCFLGAGFLSGQEIYQFFGIYGIWGLAGIFVAVVLMFGFGVLLLRLANISGCDSADKLVIMHNNLFLRAFVSVSQIFFLVGVSVIMVAGVGSLFSQTFSVPRQISSAVFCIFMFFLINGGHKRMIEFFSVTVPFLIVSTFVLSIYVIFTFRSNIIEHAAYVPVAQNKLLGTWWFSAFSFVSYNIYSSIGILAPVGRFLNSKRKVIMGVALGAMLLMITASSIFLSVAAYPSCAVFDLPMLFLAESVSSSLGIVYAVLILTGMSGTALSSMVAVVHFLNQSITVKYRYLYSALACVTAYFASLFGFSNLIGTIYPICGYFGIVAIVLMILHYLRVSFSKK